MTIIYIKPLQHASLELGFQRLQQQTGSDWKPADSSRAEGACWWVLEKRESLNIYF